MSSYISNFSLKPPSDETKKLVATGQKYYVPNYKPREMILDHGKGSRLFDIDGNDYIDLGSGIAVNGLGHQDPDLVKALETQGRKIWHTSNVFYTEPPIKLAEALVQSTPFATRVFFCNSGAEANEAAIKLARKYASERGRQPERREIITFKGSFHGRTMATVTATAQPKYQQGFEPLPGGFKYCNFNDFDGIDRMMNENVCAIMIEPIQGEGGITPARPKFMAHLRKLCDKYGALLICDEIQSGMGRTGKLWAHQHEEGLEPDIMTIAKALGGGLPIGAMLVGAKAQDVLQFGSHGTTFGGNPVMTAVALASLTKIKTPEVAKNVEKQAAALREALESLNKTHKCFKEIRGRGLMIGAELSEKLLGKAGDIIETCRLNGVLVLQAGPDVLRFLPPLTINDDEVKEGCARFEVAMGAFLAKLG